MFLMHVALQGCLRATDIEYGVTLDTGGHIRYLLELVRACADDPAVERIEIVTRAFRSDRDAACYAEPVETVDAKTRIVRLRGATDAYLAKEELWREHDALVDGLVAHVEALDRRPDILHAHYADAGRLCAAAGARLGIPYLFTAHSLGRPKRTAFRGAIAGDAARSLERRIAIEEEAIAGAAGIVASSRDEAERQYADYRAYDPGRIRIIAPGSDLAAFVAPAPRPGIEGDIERFLTDPTKPAILAIARPVRKKNLAALIHAYGGSPELRRRANLILIAGTRDELATLEPEHAETLREMLELVDCYDLYGQVAYPKHHLPDDVPAIYAYAARRRGVFVNPALNEPFGLTLLEAAASGLPVVATDSGGPNDIVETCRNGLMVDPRSTDAIAVAIGSILDDRAAWERYARAGATAVAAFDWAAHARQYLGFVRDIVAPVPATPILSRLLLVSDIDNTLVGCDASTRSFASWHARQTEMTFGIATGRSFHSALAILAQARVPRPRFVISSVGSEIYHALPGGAVFERDDDWERIIRAGWNRDAIAALMASVSGLVPQGPLEQRRYKLSYFADDTGGGTVERIRALLVAHGRACSVIHSHGRYLDILPVRASKGAAVEHVRRRYGFARDRVVVAGDSGNDVEMLRSVPCSIIVANYSDGLASRPDLAHSYVAQAGYARGVIEGVDHFRAAAGSAGR